MAADAEAAFAADEPEPAAAVIRRDGPDGQSADLAILTEDGFFNMFSKVFDGPQVFHPAFRHIALDNGQAFRPEAARATSDRIYAFCRNSGIRWLENLLAFDQSGFETIVNLGLVTWFGYGTMIGAGQALAEMRQSRPGAGADAAPREVRPGTFTHTIGDGPHG